MRARRLSARAPRRAPRRGRRPSPGPALTRRPQEAALEESRRARVSASLGVAVRKPLNQADIIARDFHGEMRARVGTKALVNPDSKEGAGFVCPQTGRLLRDSISYLDHINGKRQNAALGMSMRVERSSLEQVQERLAEHKRLREEETAGRPPEPSFEDRVAVAAEEEEKVKAERRERKQEKRRREAEAAARKGADEAGDDDELQRLMGFGGFARASGKR